MQAAFDGVFMPTKAACTFIKAAAQGYQTTKNHLDYMNHNNLHQSKNPQKAACTLLVFKVQAAFV